VLVSVAVCVVKQHVFNNSSSSHKPRLVPRDKTFNKSNFLWSLKPLIINLSDDTNFSVIYHLVTMTCKGFHLQPMHIVHNRQGIIKY
jgi:hypothetical protein